MDARATELSPAKRAQILEGSRHLFRELGFERASVDAIAARAGVSKATIYNHFQDKKALFLATFADETEGLREAFLSLLVAPTGDIEADLRRIGERLLKLIASPSHVCRHRIISAEIGRFPELGQKIYECGARAGQERLAGFFRRAGEMGLLHVESPEEAAVDFAALCSGELIRQLQLGVVAEATDELIRTNVDRAVRTFLRAYRTA